MLKKYIIGKLEKKMIMTWTLLMWLNWSIVTINDILQLLDTYRYVMSRKPEEKHTRYSLDGTETKLLVSDSKPRIHKGFL